MTASGATDRSSSIPGSWSPDMFGEPGKAPSWPRGAV
jgi:hypothetical protein